MRVQLPRDGEARREPPQTRLRAPADTRHTPRIRHPQQTLNLEPISLLHQRALPRRLRLSPADATLLRPKDATPLRPKLAIGRPSDSHEREADRVAAHIAQAHDAHPSVERGAAHDSVASHLSNADASTQLLLQPSSVHSPASGPAGAQEEELPAVVGEVLASSGRPLDARTRTFMESRLGHNFGDVRVHTGARAAESAQAVGALAYTVGRHIAFGANLYAPETPSGRALLAHELAHVVQQRQAPHVTLQRQSPPRRPAAPRPAATFRTLLASTIDRNHAQRWVSPSFSVPPGSILVTTMLTYPPLRGTGGRVYHAPPEQRRQEYFVRILGTTHSTASRVSGITGSMQYRNTYHPVFNVTEAGRYQVEVEVAEPVLDVTFVLTVAIYWFTPPRASGIVVSAF